jgi:hypothetical protein
MISEGTWPDKSVNQSWLAFWLFRLVAFDYGSTFNPLVRQPSYLQSPPDKQTRTQPRRQFAAAEVCEGGS